MNTEILRFIYFSGSETVFSLFLEIQCKEHILYNKAIKWNIDVNSQMHVKNMYPLHVDR